MNRRTIGVFVCIMAILTFLPLGVGTGFAQSTAATGKSQVVQSNRVTPQQRAAAAAALKAARKAVAKTGTQAAPIKAAAPVPGGTPDYLGGIYPNYANSPILKKFMDTLPGLNAANNLGQMIPVAVPDTLSFPGSDYYEISLREYSEKMHTQLPATRLRGYVQTNNGTAGGANTVVPATIHYLGPIIVAQKDRPVRIKFTNELPTGTAGKLFIPVDTSAMGAGLGPDGVSYYAQNRSAIHLHGGVTPWISDGTPHQWTTPAGEVTPYARGVSVQFVPDMWFDPITHALVGAGLTPSTTPPVAGAVNDPGLGSMTFYYTNQQSARLMFYHDHAYGITRLNVYAGIAAGYLIQDPVEQGLVTAGTIPATQIPLVIQDKTFVNAATMAAQDPTWNWGTTPPTPNTGDLWFPHVYMPNQNPNITAGANPMGRWDYGPWFWPPVTALNHMPVPCAANPAQTCPGTPNPSLTPESFMDTPLVNGTAYPILQVQPKAYRLRVLNAANDRAFNLQLYYAATAPVAPATTGTVCTGTAAPAASCTEVNMIPAVTHVAVPPVTTPPTLPVCVAGVTVGTPELCDHYRRPAGNESRHRLLSRHMAYRLSGGWRA